MFIEILDQAYKLEEYLSYIHCLGFPEREGWKATSFKELLELPHNFLCVAYDDKQQIKGFIIYSLVMDEVEIITFVVVPQDQKQGIGTKLMHYLLSYVKELQVKSVFLEVAKDNVQACSVYQHIGFEVKGERRHYYGREKDALMMAYVFKNQ